MTLNRLARLSRAKIYEHANTKRCLRRYRVLIELFYLSIQRPSSPPWGLVIKIAVCPDQLEFVGTRIRGASFELDAALDAPLLTPEMPLQNVFYDFTRCATKSVIRMAK